MAAPLSSGLFLLGGAASAAFAVVKHSSGKKKRESRASSVCPSTPGAPSTPYPQSTASWLRVGSSSPWKRSMGSTPMHALEAGSLVCFYTSLGELVTVKKGDKTWELHACLAPSPPNAEGQSSLTNNAVIQMEAHGDHTV